MKLNQFFNKEDDAVSPVIGVILMVAITVILAAVIAAFVFGMDTPTKAPAAQLKFTASATDGLTIKHSGGDPLVLDELDITVKTVTGGQINGTVYESSSMKSFLGNIDTLTPGLSETNTSIDADITSGNVIIVSILDVPSGQLIVDNVKVTVSA